MLIKFVQKLFHLVFFCCQYVFDLVMGALEISMEVLTPHDISRPATVAMPLAAKTDFEIALLSNLITFSPGSMVVGINDARNVLYVHCMFVDSEAATITALKTRVERRMLKVVRW